MVGLLTETPRALCILRLSSVGDTCHALPLIATLRARWPGVEIDWIIGEVSHQLMEGLPGVRFHVRNGNSRDLIRTLRGRRFDALLHLHATLRANLITPLVRAPIKLGYDRERSRDGHAFFVNHRIPAARRQHMQLAYLSFAEQLGASEPVLRWDVPVPEAVRRSALRIWPAGGQPRIIVHPCASNRAKTWTVEGYAALVRHAVDRGAEVALTGGPSERERRWTKDVREAADVPCLDLAGELSLKQLFALLETSDVYVGPDTGPTHMAAAAGCEVLGLYGATDPRITGPFGHLDDVVSNYEQTVLERTGKQVDLVPYKTRFHTGRPLEGISPKRVLRTFDRLWSRRVESPTDAGVQAAH